MARPSNEKFTDRAGFLLQFDGGSRGNPGPAGAGFVLTDGSGATVVDGRAFLGVQTNNFAEYSALLLGLQTAFNVGVRTLHVQGDSKLAVNQLAGAWKCKSPNLLPLFRRCDAARTKFDRVTFEHIGRALNADADALANAAMDDPAGRGTLACPIPVVRRADKKARFFKFQTTVHVDAGRLLGEQVLACVWRHDLLPEEKVDCPEEYQWIFGTSGWFETAAPTAEATARGFFGLMPKRVLAVKSCPDMPPPRLAAGKGQYRALISKEKGRRLEAAPIEWNLLSPHAARPALRTAEKSPK